MSIGKIQEKILTQKGCGTAIAIGMAFVMSFFIFGQCAKFSGANAQAEESSPGSSEVVSIGDAAVTSAQIEDYSKQQSQPGSTFDSSIFEVSNALTTLMRNAAYQFIAKRDHVQITDAALLKAADSQIDEYLEMQKMQMGMKPGQTPAEADAAFKKRTGKTPKEAKLAMVENLKTGLTKADVRAKIVNQFTAPVLQDALVAAAKPTDAEVRASYDSYVLKRILISRLPGMDPKSRAADALKAVKGGMSFEAAMDKYSGEPPQKGKKVSDNVITLPRTYLSSRPSYKVLDGQKVGFVSPVEDDPEGESIYKITAIKNDAPKDFEANREKYRKQFSQQGVQQKLEADVKAVLASKDVKWDNKGYEALFDFSQIQQAPGQGGAALQKIVDEAQAAMKDPTAKTPALYAWYQAETAQYESPGADKTKLLPARIEVLSAVLDSTEDFDLRLKLADLYIQSKKGPEALNQLVQAMQTNTNYDSEGQKKFGDLSAKAESLVKSNLVKEADLKPFQAAQELWRKGKRDDDQSQAEIAAQTKVAKAQQDANEKANAEEVKKQKAALELANKNKPHATPTATPPKSKLGSVPLVPTSPPPAPSSPANPSSTPATPPKTGAGKG